jgi:hypothetical protein
MKSTDDQTLEFWKIILKFGVLDELKKTKTICESWNTNGVRHPQHTQTGGRPPSYVMIDIKNCVIKIM